MLNTKQPICWIFSPSDYTDEKWRKHLDEERSSVRKTVESLNQFQVRDDGYLTTYEFFRFFNQHKKRIHIIHLVGYNAVPSPEVRADAESWANILSEDNLRHFLIDLKHAKLVFLSGTVTPDFSIELAHAVIPLLIATSRGMQDKTAKSFAIRFYKGLQGQSIGEAFEAATYAVKLTTPKKLPKTRYARAKWIVELEAKELVPWEISYNHPKLLQWKPQSIWRKYRTTFLSIGIFLVLFWAMKPSPHMYGGQVKDTLNNDILPDVKVTIEGTKMHTYTDSTGYFCLTTYKFFWEKHQENLIFEQQGRIERIRAYPCEDCQYSISPSTIAIPKEIPNIQ